MSSERPEDELLSLVKARVPIIQIVSYEVHRVHALLIGLANSCARKLYVWDLVRGIRHWDPDTKQFVVIDIDEEGVKLGQASLLKTSTGLSMIIVPGSTSGYVTLLSICLRSVR